MGSARCHDGRCVRSNRDDRAVPRARVAKQTSIPGRVRGSSVDVRALGGDAAGPMSDIATDPSAVAGFRFAGLASGIKKDGKRDLALIAADEPVAAAALFTRNRVRAAPVELSAARIERGRAQAILVNSGNANACTGKEGDVAARVTTAAVADALDITDDLVLVASTGVIGEPLPADRIEQAVPRLVAALSEDGWRDFADAILTTDRGPKIAVRRITIGRRETATVLGIAKGAGMIHPNMATTLAFVVTDAPMHSTFLRRALRTAADVSFHTITVDGETSTNDTIFALSSGRIACPPLRGTDRDAKRFTHALGGVLEDLARAIVADGEGAQHTVDIEVVGGPSATAAMKVARRIAGSLLVKTALHGHDPNWGRILAAAGMAGVVFDPSKVEIKVGDVVIVRKGTGVGTVAEAQAREVMRTPSYTIRVKLGPGRSQARCTTCDLGDEYIRINAGYRS